VRRRENNKILTRTRVQKLRKKRILGKALKGGYKTGKGHMA
jgi:hypothetical protein